VRAANDGNDGKQPAVTVEVEIPRSPQAPARARRAVDQLSTSIDADLKGDVALLVSELVTNSVKHGAAGDLKLHITAPTPRRLRVEVVDQGFGFLPKPREEGRTEPGGWGLHLVEQLADRWGVHEGSTHVWFEIDR
jgi:anti-sigma regulatory factor (Ser/Thr protein kinase)